MFSRILSAFRVLSLNHNIIIGFDVQQRFAVVSSLNLPRDDRPLSTWKNREPTVASPRPEAIRPRPNFS